MKEPKKTKVKISSIIGIIAFCLIISSSIIIPITLGIFSLIPSASDFSILFVIALELICPPAILVSGTIIEEKKTYEEKLTFYKNTYDKYIVAKQFASEYKKAHEQYENENYNYNRKLSSSEYIIKSWSKQINDANKKIDELHVNIESINIQIQNTIKDKEHAYTKAGLLYAQAALLENKANEIQKFKMHLYNLGIVPPSYRTLDAMIMINSIFINDQADTMREATLLYDTRVFRGEVLTGIEQIYNMLGKMSRSMIEIESKLLEVRNEIQYMNAEMSEISQKLTMVNNNMLSHSNEVSKLHETLYTFARDQYNTNKNLSSKIDAQIFNNELLHSSLLDQTKAFQYAQISNQNAEYKYNWYIEQNRQGLL